MYPVRAVLSFGVSLLTLFGSAPPIDPATMTAPRMSEPWWQERFIEKQAELHRQPVRLIFLGDSIFHSFEWDPSAPVWNHWYSGRGAVNLGFNGDGTADVIWRVRHGELNGLSPQLAVILIGTNDLGELPDKIADNIEKLAQDIHARSPATRILILGLLPSGRPQAEQDLAKEVNARLSAYYARRDSIASYRDPSCVFLHHGQLNLKLFREPPVPGSSYPLHPTPEGMDLLAAFIEPVVAAALEDGIRTRPGGIGDTDCPAGK